MSTIMQETTPIACPDWCETDHGFDPEDGGHDGPSWPVPSLTEDTVTINTALDHEHSMLVYLEADCALTPDQAREAGLALLSAASWAKDHQVPA